VIKVIIAIGFLGWLFPVPIVVLMGMSRALFALSSDRVLPESVVSVANRHTPAVALLVKSRDQRSHSGADVYLGLSKGLAVKDLTSRWRCGTCRPNESLA